MKHVYVVSDQVIYSFAPNSVVKTKVNDASRVVATSGIVSVPRDPIFYAGLSLTNLCGLSCRHCSVETASHPGDALAFSPSMLDDLLESMRRQGLARVSLTGGEPFLYPHLGRAIMALGACGVDTRLNTNGIHADLGLLERLVMSGLSEVDVSINDADDDSDTYRRRENTALTRFAAVGAIARRFKGRLVITASSVMTKRVAERFEDIATVLENSGADQWRLRELMPTVQQRLDPDLFPAEPYLVARLQRLAKVRRSLKVFGYLYDIVNGAAPAARCKNLENHYLFVQYDRRCYWMHGLLDAYVGEFSGGNVPEIAAELSRVRVSLRIPARCEACPARFVCVTSPAAHPAIAVFAR